MTQYVYIIAAENGLFKIGKTTNIDNRLQQIKSANPIQCFLVGLIEAKDDNLDKLERLLHKMFKDKRIRGEWFALSKNDLLLLIPYMPEEYIELIECLENALFFEQWAAAQRRRRAREAREGE